MNALLTRKIEYPDQDGNPMADNTLQFRWITTLMWGLADLFRDRADVFVAGDLLWYPVEGSNKIRMAPDVMVVFGRPQGDRGSYRQWEEDNIPPQVVFEVLSPGNRAGEMKRKLKFFERYGVEEYYIYDPDNVTFTAYRRSGNELKKLRNQKEYTSRRLGIRFDMTGDELVVYLPDGERLLSPLENAEQRKRLAQNAKQEARRAKSAEAENALLRKKLRDAGIDPDAN